MSLACMISLVHLVQCWLLLVHVECSAAMAVTVMLQSMLLPAGW
jgi:hypothetical protein